ILAQLRHEIGSRPNWAAISTHPGEEDLAARIHVHLRKRTPDLLSNIVPRHPERADAVHSQHSTMGLVLARRSYRDPITPETDILLGDTIGEMGLYLRLTEIAFVGRSMIANGGGQNPLEPAVLNTAIIAGEAVHNFRDTYDMLLEGGGARLVPDARTLCATVHELLHDVEERRRMIAAGRSTMDQMRGALRRTLRALEPYIQPLVVKARLERDQQQPGEP